MDEIKSDQNPEEERDFISAFISESEEHLLAFNDKLLDAERVIKQGGNVSGETFNCMFRAVHTIKGTASFLELTDIIDVSHMMETLMQRIRDQKMHCTPRVMDVLFRATDTLTNLIGNLKNDNPVKVDIRFDIERIQTLLDDPTLDRGQPKEAFQSPANQVLPVKKSEQDIREEDYLEQFIIEIGQDIDDFDQRVLALSGQQTERETIDGLLRDIHDIKAKAGVVNVVPFKRIAHSCEDLLLGIKGQGQIFNQEALNLLTKVTRAFKELVFLLKTKRQIDVDISPLCFEIESFLKRTGLGVRTEAGAEGKDVEGARARELLGESLVDWRSLSRDRLVMLADAIEKGNDGFQVIALIEKDIPMKSIKRVLIEERLKKIGIVISLCPDESQIDAVQGDVLVGAILCSVVNENDIHRAMRIDGVRVVSLERTEHSMMEKIINEKKLTRDVSRKPISQKGASMAEHSEEQKSPSGPANSAPIDVSIIRIDSRKLDKLMNLSGELVIVRAQYARLVSLFNREMRLQKEVVSRTENILSLMASLQEKIAGQIRLKENEKDMNRIRKNLGDLSLSLQEINKKIKETNNLENIYSLDETTNSLEKISSEIQAGVMQTRMIPIEGVFTRFKRSVRDISKDLGKEVTLAIEGEETELDKKIVDELGDPLIHMIRNAIDHGIEEEAERLKAGKPKIGNLLLKAFHKGSSICIEVSDDGRGIDPEEFVRAALKKKLINAEEASKLNAKQKLDLMFLPGFSTAEMITELSGRGVGMDVVNTMINSVGGIIDIQTTPGKGTTFVLKIPLTLAIIQALLVQVGKEIYAFPVETITEIIKIKSSEIYSIDGHDTVKLRGHALSLVELENIIKIQGADRKNTAQKTIVIITDGKRRLGVLVDDLKGKEEIVIKSLSDHFTNVKGLSGASILADGRVALILDPLAIIKEST